jgi:hypothetical protein
MEEETKGSGGDRGEDFSLVQGGPLYKLFSRCRLMRPPMELLGRRMIVLVLLAWMPLLLINALAGTLTGNVTVPFFHHLAPHARLLGSLPLLLLAEVIVHQRIAIIVRQFTAQGLVPPESRERFDGIVRSSRRLAESAVPEIILVVLACTLGHWLWFRNVAMPFDTWYGRPTPDGYVYSAAGLWFVFVSLTLFRFLLYRWYFRLFIWYRFLWKVSRLPLNLNAAHPDQAAGLGILAQSAVAFAPILVAHTISMAGLIGDQIWHRGLDLTRFKIEIGVVLGGLLFLVVAPLLFFAPRLARVRRTGLKDHAVFAARYVDDFTRKWIRNPQAPSPLGTPDLQSLADLANSHRTIRETRLVPIGKKTLMQVAVLMALPLLPLLLTLMPLEEILARLAKLMV